MTILKSGDQAPDFAFTGADGLQKKLSDFRGRKIVLYFYPKDNTPGCTQEACSLRDGYEELTGKGYEVIGVSPDSEKSHAGFRGKFNLPFHLVADTDKLVATSYGVWGKKKMLGREYMGVIRTTFIIDEKGLIDKVIDKVDTKNHSGQVINLMEN
ncbi:MAG: thioredoxin-dependent thiol peroxidase [Bacteroidales bacterium]